MALEKIGDIIEINDQQLKVIKFTLDLPILNESIFIQCCRCYLNINFKHDCSSTLQSCVGKVLVPYNGGNDDD